MSNGDISHRWYAARHKPLQAHIAMEHLRRQNFEPYAPLIRIERLSKRDGRIVIDSESLFPSYLLIRFNLTDAAWRAINSTRGILHLLSASPDARPSALPVGEVESIQAREKKGLLFVSEVKRLRHGEKVRLKYGVAADQIGTVICTRAERVTLLLNLLGRQVRVYTPLHAVEVVPQHKMLRALPVR